MMNRKIYLYWDDYTNKFRPSGRLPDEEVRNTPQQGYGVCEIAAFLSDEVQSSLVSVNIWIKNISDLKNSLAPDGMFGAGNAHWVLITDNYVFMCNDYVENLKVIMNREQIFYVLQQYKLFLENCFSHDDTPVPIDVEFITEGKDALDLYRSIDGYHDIF